MNRSGKLRPAMEGIGGAGGAEGSAWGVCGLLPFAALGVGSASSSSALITSANGGISTITMVCNGDGMYREPEFGEPGAASRPSMVCPPGMYELIGVIGPGGLAWYTRR